MMVGFSIGGCCCQDCGEFSTITIGEYSEPFDSAFTNTGDIYNDWYNFNLAIGQTEAFWIRGIPFGTVSGGTYKPSGSGTGSGGGKLMRGFELGTTHLEIAIDLTTWPVAGRGWFSIGLGDPEVSTFFAKFELQLLGTNSYQLTAGASSVIIPNIPATGDRIEMRADLTSSTGGEDPTYFVTVTHYLNGNSVLTTTDVPVPAVAGTKGRDWTERCAVMGSMNARSMQASDPDLEVDNLFMKAI